MEEGTKKITRKEFLDSIKGEIFGKLVFLGEKLGFETEMEWKTKTGEIDYVWYLEYPHNFCERKDNKIPIVGFELETGWRTRKHLKGDVLNLLELSPALCVIIILEKGFKGEKSKFNGCVKAVKRYAERFDSLGNIVVWSEKELEEMDSRFKDYKRPKEFVSRYAEDIRNFVLKETTKKND